MPWLARARAHTHTRSIVNCVNWRYFDSPLSNAMNSKCDRDDVFDFGHVLVLVISMRFSIGFMDLGEVLFAQLMLSIFTAALPMNYAFSSNEDGGKNAKKSIFMEFRALHRCPKMSFRFDAVTPFTF